MHCRYFYKRPCVQLALSLTTIDSHAEYCRAKKNKVLRHTLASHYLYPSGGQQVKMLPGLWTEWRTCVQPAT
ncbi:Protein of unknown function [Pyronema omphalodes CBS 100304]|uniref:Uncharacterized protein n=1 Tax=Pyronema omphalodes (strain CBS 100304) TaxID=1076935 RepID=U4LKG2_PYROM|nr:Protein of unknown function [Pyronema omphalodes CBS 100304]